MSKILVVGANGFVGSIFCSLSAHKDLLVTPSSIDFDITNLSKMRHYVKNHQITSIINFAGYTNVAKAQTQINNRLSPSWKLNVVGVKNLSTLCDEYKIFLVHISTDFVFSGDSLDKGPYLENHPICTNLSKMSWYAYTKAQGELVLKESTCLHAVVRMSYPYTFKNYSKLDFAREKISLYKSNSLYPLFSDQIITPTSIESACAALDIVLKNKKAGIFHLASSNTTTPYKFTKYLLQKYFGKDVNLEKDSLREFRKESNIVKPLYGGLSVLFTEQSLSLKFNTWQRDLDVFVENILAKDFNSK